MFNFSIWTTTSILAFVIVGVLLVRTIKMVDTHTDFAGQFYTADFIGIALIVATVCFAFGIVVAVACYVFLTLLIKYIDILIDDELKSGYARFAIYVIFVIVILYIGLNFKV